MMQTVLTEKRGSGRCSFGGPLVLLWCSLGNTEDARYIYGGCMDVSRRCDGGLTLVSRRCNGGLTEMSRRSDGYLTEVYASNSIGLLFG